MHKFLIIDTETGGLDPQVHSLLQLGAIVWEDGKVKATFEVDVAEEPMIVQSAALIINRIDLRSRPLAWEPSTALHKFREFLHAHFGISETMIPCGHNVALDIAMVKRLEKKAGRTDAPVTSSFHYRTLDVMSLIYFEAMRRRELPQGLSQALRWYGIDGKDADRHTALGDARLVAELLTAFYVQQTELV